VPNCFIFSLFTIIIDTVASAKLWELQTLARFLPASIFLMTDIFVSKVTVFLVLVTPFSNREQSVFLMDIMGRKVTINLKELH